jgi:hypothetical protein
MEMAALKRWAKCALRPCRYHAIGGRIFLCYRNDDSVLETTILQKLLRDRFGRANVFRDIDIPAGEDYRDAIRRELDSCFAVLVIIGRKWLTVTDQEGKRRIDGPHDMLRREIELALESDARTRVIPVLVDGTQMPRSDELPDSVARLAYRISCELSRRHLEDDANHRLIPRLETPRHSRFGRWRDIRGEISADVSRRVPVWALVAHALWRPFWSNTAIPVGLLAAGLILRGAAWLLVLAPVAYAGLAAITLFDLEQARCVRNCFGEAARAEKATRHQPRVER